MGLAKIGTLWVGAEMSWLEQLCLQSFVDHGHEVTLFCYENVANVPKGVRQEPASGFLPGDDILLHTKTGSPAYHADKFRLRMLQGSDLIWVDTDAYCCQPWDLPEDSHFHGWISDDKPMVNNGVLGLPKDSETLRLMLEFTADPYPIPPWFSAKKQADLMALKQDGKGVHVSDLPWGVLGPNALTWFLKESGEIRHAQPGHVLYPVPFARAGIVFNAARRAKADGYIKPDTLSVHFWGRRFRNIAATYGGIPEAGTLVDDLLKQHRIDPAPTAHKFVLKDAPHETPVWVEAILTGMDSGPLGTLADINGSAPDLAIALSRRHSTATSFVALDRNGALRDLPEEERAAYRRKLTAQGVASEDISFLATGDDLPKFDVIATLNGFGAEARIKGLDKVLTHATRKGTRVVLDVKKGSGAYPFMRGFGDNATLTTDLGHPDRSRAITTIRGTSELPQNWDTIARGLSGDDGFYDDLGDHSFVFVKRDKTLVVTFDNLDIVMTKREDRRPWGFSFIEKNGWSMLGVMASGWTWFRDPAVIQKFEALRDDGFFARFDRVIFYGASMGGYGACVFSSIVPGATVVAISPQSTLDKSIVPWETRYSKAWGADFSGPYGDAANTTATAHQVNIFYDPHQPLDAGHAARITGDNVVHWRCPLLGHRLGSSLNQMGVLGDIVSASITGDLSPARFYRALRARKTFPRYQKELLAQVQKRGRTGLARILCQYVLAQRDDRYFRKQLAALN